MAAEDPPRTIRTIEAHTAGEPLRIVVDGFPTPRGDTMLERRHDARARLDGLRRALMWEPRGHADMYGALPTPPATPDGDLGVLFLHNEGWSTMCGHGIVALVTAGLQEGLIPADRGHPEVRLDTPAGRVTAWPELDGTRVRSVTFRNVPSFALALDASVDVPGLGRVGYDLAFGGAFYAYVDADALGLELEPAATARLIEAGVAIRRAVESSAEIRHPTGADDLNFLYGTILVRAARGDAPSRNVCVFADGEVDRSPTGTGVSGRAALAVARGTLAPGEWTTIESLIGTRFDVRAAETTRVGELDAVVPEVRGTAFVTGRAEHVLDPADPLRDGFLLRR